jgi:hypothetical protein
LQNESFTIRKFKGLNKPARIKTSRKKPEGITWGKVGNAAAGTAAVNLPNLLQETK